MYQKKGEEREKKQLQEEKLVKRSSVEKFKS